MAQGSGTAYKELREKISKRDLFACLALWTERCPHGTSEQGIEQGQDVKSDDNDEVFEEPPTKRQKEDGFIEQNVETRNQPNVNGGNGIIKEVSEAKKILNNQFISNNHKFQESEVAPGFQETAEKVKVNKVGVVVTDADDQIVGMDFSHDNMHAVTSALIGNPIRARGGTVYVSRKPCTFCIKLLAELKIKRIFYLPFEPEIPVEDDLCNAERIQKICGIAASVAVPHISDCILKDCLLKASPFTHNKADYKETALEFMKTYWNNDWLSKASRLLMWPEFQDLCSEVSIQVKKMFDWLAIVTICDVPDCTEFVSYDNSGSLNSIINSGIFCPNPESTTWQSLALHMVRMAHILSKYSDDPTRGVGAVILKENSIVGAGWNCYTSDALYGDFPRAASKHVHIKNKRYPFSIHGEQSVILHRFVTDIKDESTTIFVNKMPCDECVPLMLRVGVKNVVFPPEKAKKFHTQLKVNLLKTSVASGRLRGFVARQSSGTSAIKDSESRNQFNDIMKD
ncbi:predicted protein [Nematostella vectensis]|uniref:dCMP deaminase n=1 Tax=Nematostella vectensis TaxID=45351 RepID=A7SGR7_NEMVE|nr:cytidine and dCMP deaminase domain-containing protein 1 [Nematostella vectensis]EDO37110.1 predicted protein [Nematostella vectensis]|eukprot:XP_001629173.1 predicted protein [Nematostella vectensis]